MSCFSSNIFSPLYIISPPLGISNKLIQRRSVDFPEPEEPIIQTTSPFSTEKSISFKTSCVPKDLFTRAPHRQPNTGQSSAKT